MKYLKEFRNYLNITQEKLANTLEVKTNMISKYESGQSFPSYKNLLKLTKLLEISFDYLALNTDCIYPKNIKLLKLANKLDNFSKPEARSNIETTTKSLLGSKIKEDMLIKQDMIELELTDNFNDNLKIMRNTRELSQNKLGKMLNTSGPAIALYEKDSYPSIKNLILLSEILNISIHALATGKKLTFQFTDGHFGKTMLLADKLLSLEDQKVLIHLMTRIIEDS